MTDEFNLPMPLTGIVARLFLLAVRYFGGLRIWRIDKHNPREYTKYYNAYLASVLHADEITILNCSCMPIGPGKPYTFDDITVPLCSPEPPSRTAAFVLEECRMVLPALHNGRDREAFMEMISTGLLDGEKEKWGAALGLLAQPKPLMATVDCKKFAKALGLGWRDRRSFRQRMGAPLTVKRTCGLISKDAYKTLQGMLSDEPNNPSLKQLVGNWQARLASIIEHLDRVRLSTRYEFHVVPVWFWNSHESMVSVHRYKRNVHVKEMWRAYDGFVRPEEFEEGERDLQWEFRWREFVSAKDGELLKKLKGGDCKPVKDENSTTVTWASLRDVNQRLFRDVWQRRYEGKTEQDVALRKATLKELNTLQQYQGTD